MVLMDCSECEGKVSDKASTCPHCGCPLRYSANATTDLTTDSSGEEEIGTESRRFPQRRQDEYHIYKEVNSNVLKDIEEARKQQAVERLLLFFARNVPSQKQIIRISIMGAILILSSAFMPILGLLMCSKYQP
jgi:hypothetical protein